MTVRVTGKGFNFFDDMKDVQVNEKKVFDEAFDTISKTKRLCFVIHKKKNSEISELSFNQKFQFASDYSFLKDTEQTAYVSLQFFNDMQQKLINTYGSIRFGDRIQVIGVHQGQEFLISEFYAEKGDKSPVYAENPEIEIKFRLSATTIIID